MAIFKRLLGYECQQMPLSDVEEWARELQEKYARFASTYQA